MPDQQPGEAGLGQDDGQNRSGAGLPGPAGAERRPSAGRPGYWFPLLLFGGLAMLAGFGVIPRAAVRRLRKAAV